MASDAEVLHIGGWWACVVMISGNLFHFVLTVGGGWRLETLDEGEADSLPFGLVL